MLMKLLDKFRLKYFMYNPVKHIYKGAEVEASSADIENHLELGKRFLANNQLSDALTHYHAAVGKD